MQPEFPIEFLVEGTPVSSQTKRVASRTEWRERVTAASRLVLPEASWATEAQVAVTLFYFPDDKMQGDIDNIVKPVLDALAPHLYLDDSQVDRILVQRFEPGKLFPFANPSPTLADAIGHPKPVLYIRVSDNPLGN